MKILDAPSSGSMQGTTRSHNRFGQYARSRSIPVNPRSTQQGVVRARLSTNAANWKTLTANQRAGWTDLGISINRSDALGQSYDLNGFLAFCMVNLRLRQPSAQRRRSVRSRLPPHPGHSSRGSIASKHPRDLHCKMGRPSRDQQNLPLNARLLRRLPLRRVHRQPSRCLNLWAAGHRQRYEEEEEHPATQRRRPSCKSQEA